MASAAHNRVAFQGTLAQFSGGGTEIFEFTMADMSSLTPEECAGFAEPVMNSAWGDGTLNLGCSVHATFTGVRVESVSGTGAVTGSYFVPASLSGNIGLNSEMICTVTCNAVTLETGVTNPHGRKVRGRFYPPAQIESLTGATAPIGNAQIYATGWRKVIANLNAAGLTIAVASSTSAGLCEVIGVSADTVIDTQRRRKNHVTSQRSTIVLV